MRTPCSISRWCIASATTDYSFHIQSKTRVWITFCFLSWFLLFFLLFCFFHLCQTNIYHKWSLTLFLVSFTESRVALFTPGIQRESRFFFPHAGVVVISSLSCGFCGFCWKSWSHHCPFHHCLVWVFSTCSLIPPNCFDYFIYFNKFLFGILWLTVLLGLGLVNICELADVPEEYHQKKKSKV